MKGPLALVRDRLAEDLRTHLIELADVGSHPGRLTPEQVREISAVSPACRVGLYGAVRTQILSSSGAVVAMPRYAAVFVVRAYDLLDSADLAMDLALRAAAFIADWVPGQPDDARGRQAIMGCGLPQDISIEDSDADELRREGIILWGCLFTVPLHTGTNLADNADERYEIEALEGVGDWEDPPE